jgi:hypothetical protein
MKSAATLSKTRGAGIGPLRQRLCENSSFKCGAGYRPAAAHRAALVFNTEKPAGSRLRADGPPHKAVFTQTHQIGAIALPNTSPKLTHGAGRSSLSVRGGASTGRAAHA